MEGKKLSIHSPTSFFVPASKIESLGRRNKEDEKEGDGELSQSGKISKKRKRPNDVKNRREKNNQETIFDILGLPAQPRQDIKPFPGGDGNSVRKDGDENKRKKKRKSKNLEKGKEEIVISPYFKEKNVCFMKKCTTQVSENPQTESAKVLDVKKKRERKHFEKGKEEVVISPYFKEKNMCFMKKCWSQVSENPQTESADVKKKWNGDQVKIEKGSLLDDLFSQFAYTGITLHKSASNKTEDSASIGSQAKINVEKGIGSETENVQVSTQRKRGRVVKQPKTESKKLKAVVSPYFHHKANEIRTKAQAHARARARAASLTAAQKRDEAYQRKTPDNNWTPPRSPFNLLQEDHAFDPWRVLVICMLLNQTTGLQAARVLPNLFQICPDAKTAMKADVNQVAEVIHSLGLYKKRAEMIRRLSAQYVDQSWTHVTDLPGVGK